MLTIIIQVKLMKNSLTHFFQSPMTNLEKVYYDCVHYQWTTLLQITNDGFHKEIYGN